ncbi:hypothetical protein Murru_2465 [Allomuricauda ruestringensis DSM 13258]|uniref:Transmembrane protein n=1 Tax=Allomuricauda ruestringensis (strain DSM 13258 / CIP 107369 / LMG 19739 / B1) TaxID=886377 RepID=G2PPK2_ALLRU|nr:hypothetical protein Murru_2465 [Allomuricauda ruestringensis DSM 13258]
MQIGQLSKKTGWKRRMDRTSKNGFFQPQPILSQKFVFQIIANVFAMLNFFWQWWWYTLSVFSS